MRSRVIVYTFHNIVTQHNKIVPCARVTSVLDSDWLLVCANLPISDRYTGVFDRALWIVFLPFWMLFLDNFYIFISRLVWMHSSVSVFSFCQSDLCFQDLSRKESCQSDYIESRFQFVQDHSNQLAHCTLARNIFWTCVQKLLPGCISCVAGVTLNIEKIIFEKYQFLDPPMRCARFLVLMWTIFGWLAAKMASKIIIFVFFDMI